jgi:hypothetical protein
MVESRLQTKSALVQLSLLLVAHCHVVEKLESNVLVSLIA